MENFTPVSAIIGGLMIGSAAALLLWLNGKVAGISGIVGGALGGALGDTARSDRAWRLTFIAGLIAAPLLLALAGVPLPLPQIEAGWPLIIAGGLLVGFGTALGSGCTSGHGVCGLGRLSRRSLAATLVFMGTGAATVFVLRHLIGG